MRHNATNKKYHKAHKKKNTPHFVQQSPPAFIQTAMKVVTLKCSRQPFKNQSLRNLFQTPALAESCSLFHFHKSKKIFNVINFSDVNTSFSCQRWLDVPSSCRRTSCRAHLHPRSYCRTSWRSWRPPQCRDTRPQPADPRSTQALRGDSSLKYGICMY